MPQYTGYPQSPQDFSKVEELRDRELKDRKVLYTPVIEMYHDRLKFRKPSYDKDTPVTWVNLLKQVARQATNAILGIETGVTGGIDFNHPEHNTLLQKSLSDYKVQQAITACFLNGVLFGHSFAKLYSVNSVPHIIPIHPYDITVFWNTSVYGDVSFYRIEFKEGDVTYREDIVKHPDKWEILQYVNHKGNWSEPNVIPWELPYPPIVEWGNMLEEGSYYGTSELLSLPDLVIAYNTVLYMVMKILRFHSHPKTVLIGGDGSQIEETAIDGLWSLMNPEAKILNLEMQSDLSATTGFGSALRASIFALASELDPIAISDRLRDISNFGLQVLAMHHVAKVSNKRVYATPNLKIVASFILSTLFGSYIPPEEFQILWADVLPKDQLQDAQSRDIDRKNGLSMYTYLQSRGYNPDSEVTHRMVEDVTITE